MGRENFIPPAPGKQLYLLKRETYQKLMEMAARPEVKMDPTQFDMIERGGAKFYRFKQPQGKPDSTKKGGWDRFGVWMDEARQMLMVDPGAIVYQGAVGGSYHTPIFPYLDGTAVNEKDSDGWGPGFDVGGLSTGVTYSLVLTYEVMECGVSRVPEETPAEGIDELKLMSPGELEGLDLKENEAAVIVADIRFGDGDLGLKIEKVDQYLGSDFHPMCSGGSESYSDSSPSSDDEDSSSSSSDSDDDSTPSGSSDPEDPSSSDGPGCCSDIQISLSGLSVKVGGTEDCFTNSETAGYLWATVSFEVVVEQSGPDACGANCRNWYASVTVPGAQVYIPGGGGVAGQTITYALGLSGAHTFALTFRLLPAAPCSDRTIHVEVGNNGGANLVSPEMRERCEQTLCRKAFSFRTPPWCFDDCSSSESDYEPTPVDPDPGSSSDSSSDPDPV